jgi:nucleoside-diphosphate-sugar epimerase
MMMRVFVAGATGAIGKQLVPRLVEAGHEVHGMTRSESKQAMLHELGAVPVVADALDPDQVAQAVGRAKPDVIVHQLTAIPATLDLRHFDRDFALTNRLRTEGTDHLLSAGQAVGVRRFVAQSYGAWPYMRTGGPVKSEEDPLDPAPAREMRRSAAAIRHLEQAVLGARWTEGVVLRYGSFYGPGTSMAPGSAQTELVRKRRFPLVGDGGGVWSFIHVASAASATWMKDHTPPPSPTPRRRRWRRSSAAAAAPTTSSTTTPPRSPSGCRRWPGSSVPRSPCAYRGSSGGCSPGRPAW